MTEPRREIPDPIELAVDQAIAACDGDVRAALRAALVANTFLIEELDRVTHAVSSGFTRGRSPSREAADLLERWREISKGETPEDE